MLLRSFFALCFLVAAACTAAAQDAGTQPGEPDFSGHWVSESVKMSSGRRTPGPADVDLKIDLIISRSGAELKVKESTVSSRGKYSRDLIYYLDGRGESNRGFTPGFEYESKTVRDDRKLQIKGTVSFPGSSNNSTQTEEWLLSEDGETLTIRTETTSTRGARNAPGTVRYEKVFRLRR